MPKSNVSYLWRDCGAARGFRSGVSLHGHTNQSHETLDFLANLGAREAGGKTIGLNIRLPYEQMPNRYISPELNFEFHYFFMRKYWFAYLAKALVIFPGGFGTLDELFEILTLAQTEKLAKKILVVIYGTDYWRRIINFDAMVDAGTVSPEELRTLILSTSFSSRRSPASACATTR